jgi:hypothetical protein
MNVVGDILPDDPVADTIRRSGPITARPAWAGEPSKVYREFNARHAGEWLPRPYHGRIMQPPIRRDHTRPTRSDRTKREPEPMQAIHLMIVPGPAGLYQVVRINLKTPVARGFRTKEDARGWIGRAVRAGVLPEGVVEVEPPPGEGLEQNVSEP